MKKTLNILYGIFILLASLTGASSCSSNSETLIYEYRPVSFDGWSKTDTIVFTLPEIEQGGLYLGQIGVRTNARYPYQKVWIGVCQKLHHPDTLFLDTVFCEIASRSDLDKNGIGLFLSEGTLPDHVYHPGQTGEIKVFHILRREEVPGICQVGLHIQRKQRP